MVQLVTLDFETYFDSEVTLKKLRTDEYVLHPKFLVHCVQIKIGEGHTQIYWYDDIEPALRQIDWSDSALIAHNAAFDGFILAKIYGIVPKYYICTMSMSRTINNHLLSHSLEYLSGHYGQPTKNTQALTATMGCRNLLDTSQWSAAELAAFTQYAVTDVNNTYNIYKIMRPRLAGSDMLAISYTIAMFTDPKLMFDSNMLDEVVKDEEAKLANIFNELGVTQEAFSSTAKFAKLLEAEGLEIPMKVSEKTGKSIPALSKKDPEFLAIVESPPTERVDLLCTARLAAKSTQLRTRASMFKGMQDLNGNAPLMINWAGASVTLRTSGGNKTNLQNMGRGSKLRSALVSPDGYSIVAIDSSNIEARVLDYIAGQVDAVETYRQADAGTGSDVYCALASVIYGRPITKADKVERYLGKITKLGLGYGMGATKFFEQIKTEKGMVIDGRLVKLTDTIDEEEAARIVKIYRGIHTAVKALWYSADGVFKSVVASDVQGRTGRSYARGIETKGLSPILVWMENNVLKMEIAPNLTLNYLNPRMDEDGLVYDRRSQKKRGYETARLYGGKIVENLVQALARRIITDQIVKVTHLTGHKPSLFVHDEGVWCIPDGEVETFMGTAIQVFKQPASYIEGIPLNAEGAHGKNYGDAK